MKKLLLLFIILGSFLSLQAQVSKTVALSTAGTLSSILSVDELNTVTNFTLTGNIDARDFKTMRDLMPVLAEVDLSGAGIVAYSGTEGTSITGNTNYPANSIPETAFMNASYKGKNSLMSITFPNSLTSIELQAFRGCSGITNVVIPSSTLYIRTYAFAACINLKAVNIPASVSSIGTYAFGDSPVAFSVDINNNSYCSENGILFNKAKTYLFQSPPSISGNYVIPSTVETIGGYAFSTAEGLNSILLPNSVKYIREGAFTACTGLTSIQFPISVITIENWAFQSCSGLKSVTAPWMVPLKLGTTVFANIDKSNCILKVPFGTTSVYQAADQWKDFQNIVEMEQVQKTYVPNDNFEQALISLGLDSGPLDDYVPSANIASVTSLNVSGKGIGDLTGIQDFASLANLDCSNNKLLTLDLSRNLGLRSLMCNNNQLALLDLSVNKGLSTLRCHYNNLISIVLPENQLLGQLYCYNNQLTAIDLSKNPKINVLGCQLNKLETLNITNLAELVSLECYGNSLSLLDISNNPRLQQLDCSDNSLFSLDLSKNPNLSILFCGRTKLSKIDLSYNTLLKKLYCEDNFLTTLDVSQNSLLETLYCHRNQISDLNLSANTKLLGLYAYNNLMSTLDLSNNRLLQMVYIENNKLNVLDVSKNTDLLRLRCYSNQISSLDLSQNIKLLYLDCSTNSLASLKLNNGKNSILYTMNASYNPNLLCIQVDNPSLAVTYNWQKDLIASYSSDCTPKTYVPDDNFEQALIDLGYDSGPLDDYVPTANIASVTSLNVSGKEITDLTGIQDFASLQELNCGSNNLTTIDISKNTNLLSFTFYSNQLTSLNVSNNSKLQQLYGNNNLITNLDLSKNPDLSILDFGNNKLTSLDISQNPLMWLLNCSQNQISTIDLTNNTNLEQIGVSENPISNLDISRNLKLKWFYISATKLEKIDCINHKALESIDCSRNSLLSALNLRNGNNTILKNVFAIENPGLSCIQVDDPSLALTYTNWAIDAQTGYSGNCALPVAIAGADQQLNEGTMVVLDGSLSFDSYGDPLTYIWTAPAGIILNTDNPVKPEFNAPEVSRERNYTFTLIVNDGTENSLVDAVTVTVKPINAAPNVICNNLTVKLDATGNYMLSSTDLKSLAAGTTDDKDSFKNLKIVAEPNAFSCQDLGNPVSVKLTVSDSEGASSTGNAFVTVQDVTPPVFSSVPRSYNVAIVAGETYILPDFSELYPAKDGCSNVTYIQTPLPGNTYTNSAKETIILKASDGYNNVAQVNISFILTVRSKLKSAELNASNEICDSPQLEVYPNPFKERVNLVLTSPTDADVILEIFNSSGIKLKTLFSGTIKGNQMNTFEYSPGDIPSQVIFYRLLIGNKLKTGKLILDK